MFRDNPLLPPARSWRDIPQEVRPRAMTRTGRRRVALAWGKIIGGAAFVVAVLGGIVYLVEVLETNPRQISQPLVQKIDFSTDGVLAREWVMGALALPKAATLVELDLGVFQGRLMANGQIRSAVLQKRYPSTLVVSLTERAPLARIMADDAGSRRELLVARDGVVYRGEGYDRAMLDQLPWLDGVRLVRSGGRIAPLKGMEVLSDLLSKARYESEHLYPLFKYVSLARLESDGEIEVRSPECEGVIFSTREDFFRQLAWLDYIRDTMAPSAEAPLSRLDLTNSTDRVVPVRPSAMATPAREERRVAQSPASLASPFRDAGPSAGIQLPQAAQPSQSPVRARPLRPSESLSAFPNSQRNQPQREL